MGNIDQEENEDCARSIAFGGVLSVADVGQAGERDRKGDREWRDEGDWKGEWKRDRDDDDDRDDDWRGAARLRPRILGRLRQGLLGWVRTPLWLLSRTGILRWRVRLAVSERTSYWERILVVPIL